MDVSRYLHGIIHHYLLYVVGVHIRDIQRGVSGLQIFAHLQPHSGSVGMQDGIQLGILRRFCDGKKDLTWGT